MIKTVKMEKNENGSYHSTPVVAQPLANSTLWIGHTYTDPTEHFGGQTFECPREGWLDNIQIYSSAVQNPGEMQLTLHEFDSEAMQWGPSIGNASANLEKGDEHKWIQFDLQPIVLRKGSTYGFRLYTGDALIGIGEAATGNHNPFTTGQAWTGNSNDRQGRFFSFFNLAFKISVIDNR
jgi:hypothetical protein